MSSHRPSPSSFPTPLPLVGREAELALIEGFLERRERPTVLVLEGDRGIGKSRLTAHAASRADSAGWRVVRGRAYRVEAGIPYACIVDAFTPLVAELGAERVDALARGGARDLARVFPTLGAMGRGSGSAGSGGEPDEVRTRMLWTFAEFVRGLADQHPLLVILEDLQGADDASLQLLHFAARHLEGHPVRFVVVHAEMGGVADDPWPPVERSLISEGLAQVRHITPLDEQATQLLLERGFAVDAQVVAEFAGRLFRWTGGNPFFIAETLRALVESGQLHGRDGTWYGWEAHTFDLPTTVHDLLRLRTQQLDPLAQRVLEQAAVLGMRVPLSQLRAVVGADDDSLLAGLDVLEARGILTEVQDGATVLFDFSHPLIREAVYSDLGAARRRKLHTEVALSLEAWYGDRAPRHADVLAVHFARSREDDLSLKAAHYLGAAGHTALARHANREAVNYLRAALDRLQGHPEAGAVTHALARAYHRLGDYEAATALWRAILSEGGATTAPPEPELRRRIATALLWAGRPVDALGVLDAISSDVPLEPAVRGRAHLTRATILLEMGRVSAARSEMEQALAVSEQAGVADLAARTHRSLGLLFLWTGPPAQSALELREGLRLGRAADDRRIIFWCHWGLAVLAGIQGDDPGFDAHLAQARAQVETLRSPVLRLWADEIAIERAYGRGDWATAVGLGERAIELARSLDQRVLLPRLLVWTAGVHFGRDDPGRAHELVDEACALASIDDPEGTHSVQALLAAYVGRTHQHLARRDYVGRTHQHLARRDYAAAVKSGREGLRLAREAGLIFWALQWLSPLVVEAHLWLDDADGAAEEGARIDEEASRLDHALGRAWTVACDAMVAWKRGDPARGAALMTRAAEALEAVPMIPMAARIRRQLAGRLAETGQRAAALRELRRVHDLFERLGWEHELEKTRTQFREVGSRPPPRADVTRPGGLSDRETEVALAVARGASNKAVARKLGISPRTVSTHLSHVYRKLEVSSRTELAATLIAYGLGDH